MTYLCMKINLMPINRTQVIKRFMMTRRGVGYIPSPVRAPRHIQSPTANLREYAIQKRTYAHYSTHDPDPTKMTHEECQNNVIVGSKGIQHPTIAITTCNEFNYENKICEKRCIPSAEIETVKHVTHDSRYPGRKISDTDLKAQNRAQYSRFYPKEKRTKVSEPEATFNSDMTEQLHKDKTMLENIQLYEKFYRK